jgi:hypothetical protein
MRRDEQSIGTGLVIPLIALVTIILALDAILGPFLLKGC